MRLFLFTNTTHVIQSWFKMVSFSNIHRIGNHIYIVNTTKLKSQYGKLKFWQKLGTEVVKK